MRRSILVCLIALLMLSGTVLTVWSADITMDELDGKHIGVQTGSINGPLAEARFPNSEISYFNSQTDVMTALKTGKIDAWAVEDSVIRFIQIDDPEYMYENNQIHQKCCCSI